MSPDSASPPGAAREAPPHADRDQCLYCGEWYVAHPGGRINAGCCPCPRAEGERMTREFHDAEQKHVAALLRRWPVGTPLPEAPPHAPPGDGRGLTEVLRELIAAREEDRGSWAEYSTRLDAAYDAAKAALSAPSPAPGSPGWVAVTDDATTLPPPMEWVLAWGRLGNCSGTEPALARRAPGGWWIVMGYGGGAFAVTHWQRIVAPGAAGADGGEPDNRKDVTP